MVKAVAEGLPKHRIEEAAAARAAKVDTGETVIVGVNRYRLAEEEEHRHPRGRQRQGPRRPDRAAREDARGAGRGEGARRAGCAGSGRARRGEPARPRRRSGPRARCSLGEISDALERAFGRYAHQPEPVRGIYGKRARRALESRGRRARKRSPSGSAASPRILVAKMGQDGHDRGANLVSARRSAIWASK